VFTFVYVGNLYSLFASVILPNGGGVRMVKCVRGEGSADVEGLCPPRLVVLQISIYKSIYSNTYEQEHDLDMCSFYLLLRWDIENVTKIINCEVHAQLAT
jgi:hypothetical protein